MLTNQEPDNRVMQTHLVFERAKLLRKMTIIEFIKFMAFVRIQPASEGECWLWVGKRHRHNYGQFNQDGDTAWVHRLSYRYYKGPIPKGLVIDHICENKNCVNPAHLKAVTLSQNNQLYHWRRRDAHNLRLPFDIT